MISKCSTCGIRHKTYDDGFDYLSCMLALKQRDKCKTTDTTKSGVISADTESFTTKVYQHTTKPKNEGFEGIIKQIPI
tara:strand:+ start:210 stop:443 length:234 start_codon:yes stop_codon:yes gene_type:complete